MRSRPEPPRPLDAFEARLLDDLQTYRSALDERSLPRSVRSPRRSRIRRSSALAAAVGLAVAGVAAAVVLTRPDAADLAVAGVACADRAVERPNLSIVVSDGRAPAALCADLWRRGEVVAGVGSVPELTACVARTGAVVVYPAPRDICSELGEDPVPAGFTAASARLTAFRREVTALLDPGTGTCPDLERAVAIVRAELTRRSIEGWSVRGDDASNGTCSTLGFDTSTHTVIVSRLTTR